MSAAALVVAVPLTSCGDVLERRREGLLDSAGHGWGEKAEERRRVFAAADRYPSSMTPGFGTGGRKPTYTAPTLVC